MELELVPGFSVVVADDPLPHLPRYSLSGYVSASPHTDQSSHEMLLRETFGSVDWLWSGDDEFRFGNADKTLKGCVLSVPEEVPPSTWNPRAWLHAPKVAGNLRSTKAEPFAAKATEVRWADDSGTLLVCAFRESPATSTSLHRIQVAHNLDLVVAEHRYTGWILHTPAEYLVHESEPQSSHRAPDGLAELLGSYLNLVVEPKVDRMMEGDLNVLNEIDEVIFGLSALPEDPRRDIMRNRLTDLRDDWYEQ